MTVPADLTAASLSGLPMLFGSSERMRISELPRFRDVLTEVATGYVADMRRLFAAPAVAATHSVAQLAACNAMASCVGLVGVTHFIPEWNAQAVVCLDRAVLFRVLDSMYGAPGGSVEVADRKLTPLEQSVATQISTALMSKLQTGFAQWGAFTSSVDGVSQSIDPAAFEKNKSEVVVVTLEVTGMEGRVMVSLPARGLEGIRECLDAPEKQETPAPDPRWASRYHRAVCGTELVLTATVAVQPMTLIDIVRLQPGSTIDFDVDCLSAISLKCGDQPVFVGRLGQSNGFFTVRLEAPIIKPERDEDEPE